MNVIKWVAISVGGLFALLLVLGIILAATGQTQPEQQAAQPTTVVTTEAPKPVAKVTPKTTPSKTTEKPKPVQKTTQATMTREQAFLTVMRTKFPQLKHSKDSVLLKAGHNVCSLFDEGYTFGQIAYLAIDSGMTGEQAGYLIGASTAAFCPKYNVGA